MTSLDLPSKYLRIIGLRFDAILCSNLGNENSDVGHVKHSRRLQVTSPVYKSIRAYFKLWSFLLLSQTKKIHTHASKTLSFFIRHELSRTLVRAEGDWRSTGVRETRSELRFALSEIARANTKSVKESLINKQ